MSKAQGSREIIGSIDALIALGDVGPQRELLGGKPQALKGGKPNPKPEKQRSQLHKEMFAGKPVTRKGDVGREALRPESKWQTLNP